MALAALKNVLELQPWNDVHRLQFLEQQLASVRNLHLGHTLGTLAVLAPSGVSQQSTLFTHMDLKDIRRDHQTLQQQHTGTVTDQTIYFQQKKKLKVKNHH